MSLFIIEATFVGAKEALKLVLVWYVLSATLRGKNKEGLIHYFYFGVVAVTLLSAVSFTIQPQPEVKDFLIKLVNYVFFVFYIGSVLVLTFNQKFKIKTARNSPIGFLILVLTVFYFSPDILGSSFFVRELSIMKERFFAVYASALIGFILSIMIYILILRRLKDWAVRFFDVGQLLLFVLIVKMLGGGIKGFAELSLLPSVQRGAMKFMHDLVHHTFVYLMVPDHPMLSLTAWNYIGILFGPNIGIALSLGLLLFPPVYFLYVSFSEPIDVPVTYDTGAMKRKYRASVRADRRRKSLPVVVFILTIVLSWYSGLGEQASTFYNPSPKPLIEDKGIVIIPLKDPTMNLMDGKIHKFSVLSDGESVTLLVVKKPDDNLVVCLDACEICPPDGYGQSAKDVVCIYCGTPIPIETLGKPGGCNPIPLKVKISDVDIRVSMEEIALKWQAVLSGETKKGITK